jgi:hypothetical protein
MDVPVVDFPGTYADITVRGQQFMNQFPFLDFEVVLDREGADLISVERKSAQDFVFSALDVDVHVIDPARSLGLLQDFVESDRDELHHRSIAQPVLVPSQVGVGAATMPPTSPAARNSTFLPDSLNTGCGNTWQVRRSMLLGNGSMQTPCQPMRSSR